MKVLYIVNPAIEFNDSLFRYNSINNSIIPQIKALKKENVDVSILVSSQIRQKMEIEGIDTICTVFTVDPVEYTDGKNENELSILWQKKLCGKEEVKRVRGLIFKAIPENYRPDIVVLWETPLAFINEIFRESKIVNQIPGFFSREPFPQYIQCLPELLSEPIIPDIELSKKDIELFSYIRDKYFDLFKDTCPFSRRLMILRKTYRKLILFPLQIDGYFMVDCVIRPYNQLGIIEQILKELPNDVGLILTEYRTKNIKSGIMNDYTVSMLKRKYNNFIYENEINNVYCCSQIVMPFVDGCITISSSVGYQCAYWHKPLLVLGKNHISCFKTAETVSELVKQLGKEYNRDKQIIAYIKNYNFSISNVDKEFSLIEYMERLFTENDTTHNIDEAIQKLDTLRRDTQYIKSIGVFENGRSINTRTHSDALSEQIRKHEVISFDIFDTLLVRPFYTPKDLFEYIEENVRKLTNNACYDFKNNRIQSEKLAFEEKLKINGEFCEITIDDIYTKFEEVTEIPSEICSQIKELEILTESKTLYRRATGYNAYLEAKELGKRIIIISDMYLLRETIDKLLKKNNILVDEVYLSSECGCKKSNGKLFEYVIQNEGIQANKMLHIGDNINGDVKQPKKYGIKSFHLPKAVDKFINDDTKVYAQVWRRDFIRHNLDARIINTVIANYTYDNPYFTQRRGTLFNGDAFLLGFIGFGPLLLGLSKWICESEIADNLEKLYFLSRDGKIIKRAYDLLVHNYKNAPKSLYLYCSRRSVNVCKIKTINDIYDLVTVDFANNILLKDLLLNRFGINYKNIDQSIYDEVQIFPDSKLTKASIGQLLKFFTKISNHVLENAKSERNNYLEYLKNKGVFSSNKIGVVDIGYAGTMQESLSAITNCNMNGYYLITFRKAIQRLLNKGLNSKGFLGEFIDRDDTYQLYCRYVPLFETLFSSDDTSFIKFNESLEPVFIERLPSEELRCTKVREIQEGAISFITLFCKIFGSDIAKIDFEPNKCLRVLLTYFSNPSYRDALILEGVIFEDAYGGIKRKVILPSIKNFDERCVWDAGYRVIKNSLNQKYHLNIDKAKNMSIFTDKDKVFKPKSFATKAIYFLYKNILSDRKLKKLSKHPELFFKDSKSVFNKIVSKWYLRGLE